MWKVWDDFLGPLLRISCAARCKAAVTVDESIREIERSEEEDKNEDDKSNICQLLKPMDGVSAQRQVLRALALEV